MAMEKSEIRQRVVEAPSNHLMIEEGGIKDSDDLQKDLGADSLDAVEIIMSLEDEFDIEIPNDEAERQTTVGQVVDFIEKALKDSGR